MLADFDALIVEERDDAVMEGGVVRTYRLPNGYGLNGINSPLAHRYPFAWEFAVLEPDPSDSSGFGDVVFDTPLTSTVRICRTMDDAESFLRQAVQWAESFELMPESLVI